MNIQHQEIDYFINRMATGPRFALVGYGDAELFSMIGYDLGKRTGLGQILDGPTGVRLLDVMKRRYSDPNFMFSVPGCVWQREVFVKAGTGDSIDKFLGENGLVDMVAYERDLITDELAEHAQLYPFIRSLQQQTTVVIGNKHLAELDFLGYYQFIEISCPNHHMEDQKVALDRIKEMVSYWRDQRITYLVSGGMSASLIIDAIYDLCPTSTFFDCGSIWDAFVGIGCQREWRRKLYSDPTALASWRRKNLEGS